MPKIGVLALALLPATTGCVSTYTAWEGRHWAQTGITPWPLNIWVHGEVKDLEGYQPVDRFAKSLRDELTERGFVPRMTVSTLPPPPPPMLELRVVGWTLPGAAGALYLVGPVTPTTEIVVECVTHPVPGNPFDFRGAVHSHAFMHVATDPGEAADAAGKAVAEELASGGSEKYPDRPYKGFQKVPVPDTPAPVHR